MCSKHIMLVDYDKHDLGVSVRYFNIAMSIGKRHHVVWNVDCLLILWARLPSCLFAVVLVAGARFRKLFGPGRKRRRKRLINVTSNGNNNASCHCRGRGFDSHTLYRGWILVLFVIVWIDKHLITRRITCVDKTSYLPCLDLSIGTYLWRKHELLSIYVCPVRTNFRYYSPYVFGVTWL